MTPLTALHKIKTLIHQLEVDVSTRTNIEFALKHSKSIRIGYDSESDWLKSNDIYNSYVDVRLDSLTPQARGELLLILSSATSRAVDKTIAELAELGVDASESSPLNIDPLPDPTPKPPHPSQTQKTSL